MAVEDFEVLTGDDTNETTRSDESTQVNEFLIGLLSTKLLEHIRPDFQTEVDFVDVDLGDDGPSDPIRLHMN